MISAWRRRRAGRRAGKKENSGENSGMELTVPTHFNCPITLELMKDPVTLSTGITYDRESIEKWIETGNQKCPVTNQVLRNSDQIPNHTIRKMIQDWCVENRSNGVERIPTPRIPVTPHEVSELGSKLASAAQRADAKKCHELVAKVKNWAKESDRNKKCMAESGLGFALSLSFDSFASIECGKNEALLMEITGLLNLFFPAGEDGRAKLGSGCSLRLMTRFLNGEDLSVKQSAVSVLKKLVAADTRVVGSLLEIENFTAALYQTVRVPVSAAAKKSALVIISHMMAPLETSGKVAREFCEMGLVPLLLETVVDADRSLSEKALLVLDALCGCCEGREKARENALTMPVLVKKIARISDVATEFLVSIMWKLCKNGDGVALVEALQLGAFQKLLVVLQVGCGDATKEKATGLLKLMNRYSDWSECFDNSSKHFKYLKTPN